MGSQELPDQAPGRRRQGKKRRAVGRLGPRGRGRPSEGRFSRADLGSEWQPAGRSRTGGRQGEGPTFQALGTKSANSLM